MDITDKTSSDRNNFLESAKFLNEARGLTLRAGEGNNWPNATRGEYREVPLLSTDLPMQVVAARSSMQGYLDRVGVTDRYAGLRSNWPMDHRRQSAEGTSALRAAVKTNVVSSKQESAESSFHEQEKSSHAWPTRSVLELGGINSTFPGKTEYMTRYNRVFEKQPITFFNVNPAPNGHIHERPLAEASWTIPTLTETHSSHQWPIATAAEKLPWQRQ